MTTTIHGRNRYADTALTRVTIRRGYRGFGDPLLIIEGGYIEVRDDGFILAAKHPSATDVEHDASYVASFEGAGLTWKDMYGAVHTFTGVLLTAQFYTEDPEIEGSCERCADPVEGSGHQPHGYLRFMPPDQKWKPALYTIEVAHLTATPNGAPA